METADLEQSSDFIERCDSPDSPDFAGSTNNKKGPLFPCNPVSLAKPRD